MEKELYGLVITFNERSFNITVNATLTADLLTDGVQYDDYMTVILVHKNPSNVVDYAYSVSLNNFVNNTYTFHSDCPSQGNTNQLFNGVFDSVHTKDGEECTIDVYGYWEIYILYPMFYMNDTTNTAVTSSNDSDNRTVSRIDDYTQYDTLVDVKNDECSNNYLGKFVLDTLTRDVTINITINKPYEYWLHDSASTL